MKPLARPLRLALSALFGLAIASVYASQDVGAVGARDLTPVIAGARLVLEGHSPFVASVAADGTGPRMLYPMPAYLLLVPFAWMPDHLVRALWAGVAVGMLTWLSTARWGLHGFALIFSRPAGLAIAIAQWSPYIVIGALSPAWQFIAAAKPTLGFIAWCYRPSRWPFVGGAVLLALSFIVLPSWVTEWRSQLTGVDWYLPAAAIWRGGGPLLLLAVLRWRLPEARLLLALACVPHNYAFYDQLLVFLVPRKASELWLLSLLSWFIAIVCADLLYDYLYINRPNPFTIFRIPIVALLYLPALGMVLSRPNEGALPHWLESRIRWVPAWLRGTASASA